jgi:hypothetical protein
MRAVSNEPEEKRDKVTVPVDVVLFIIVFAVTFTFVAWPVRDRLLVLWIYGKQGLADGIRAVSHHQFSNGQAVPTVPDMVTGFGAFFVTLIGLRIFFAFGARARILARYRKQQPLAVK